MDIDTLQLSLANRVNSGALQHLQGRIDLHCNDQVLRLQIEGHSLHWSTDSHRPTADVTFYFCSPDQAYEILCGSADLMAEFMQGRFRSSGYLLWTFPLLTLFRGSP